MADDAKTALAVRRGGPARTATTPDETLWHHEVRGGRMWLVMAAAAAVTAVVATATIDLPPRARWPFAATTVALVVALAVIAWTLRGGRRYTARGAIPFAVLGLVLIVPAYYAAGWFSAAVVLMPLGGLVYGLSQTPRAVVFTAIAVGAGHATFALLTIFGVLDEPGVTTIHHASPAAQLVLLGFVQCASASGFAAGLRMRTYAARAAERHAVAVREGAQRQVLLDEAIRDLARARQVGGEGRFTGHTLGGYRLGVVLGRGGMGEVYDARGEFDDEAVAVKVLTAEAGREPTARARFGRELEAVASLRSPHVVRLIAHGGADEPIPFLVMERLTGTTLSDLLRERPLPIAEALRLLDQIATAVDLAHATGIVHRDLKPANLFQHRPSRGPALWKVLDFGVAKRLDGEGTLTGDAVIGTPGYLAPEQATGGDVGPAADRFALGAIAYRILTGRPAFDAADVAAALYAVVHATPPCPSAIAPLPADVDAALAIALAKAPDHRFATARELADAVADACRAALPDELRRRGEALIALAPWGQTVPR
ncbi:MAG: serine/threonine protein kinase [Myxococcales bacterium]|nr:serine/threonine protein kinase [Myxococcales bacterium]